MDAPTFPKLAYPFLEFLLPLSIVSAPTVEPAVLLPSSTEVGPGSARAFDLGLQEPFKFFLGVESLFLDGILPYFS